MNELIASIIFLLSPAQTNVAVCNDAGAVRGKWDAVICRDALITLNTNGFFQLQVTEIATNNSWVGIAFLDGSITNRVTLPTNEVFLRVIQQQPKG